MSDQTKRFAPVFIIAAAILWGLDGILRRSLFELPPIIIVFYEHLIGALLIAPFLIKGLRGEAFSLKEKSALVWVSILSGVLGTLWFTTALLKTNFIPFSVVFLLQKLQPLFAITAGSIILKEKLNPSYIKWAIIALISAYFVTFPGGVVNFDTGPETIIAAMFAIGAALAWGSSTALSRYTLLKHSQTVVTGLRFMLTTFFAGIAVLILGETDQLFILNASHFSKLLLIAVSTGMVALWLYYKGLKHTKVQVATILELIFPMTAVFIDIFVYHNFLDLSQYLAAAFLLFSIHRISKTTS